MSLEALGTVAAAVILSFCIIVARIVNRGASLYLMGFSVPLISIGTQFGVNIIMPQIIGGLAVIFLLLRSVKGSWGELSRPLAIIYVTTLYVALFSMAIWIVDINGEAKYRIAAMFGLGPAQGYYKVPVQIISFLLMIAIAAAAASVGIKGQAIQKAWAGLRAGIIFSLASAVLMVVFLGTGFIASAGRGEYEIGGRNMLRIGGISGEPKHLGAILAVISIWCLCALFYARESRRRSVLMLLMSLVGLLFTFSTSAWIGFTVGFVLLAVWMALSNFGARAIKMLVTLALVVAALSTWGFLRQAVSDRVDDRLISAKKQRLATNKEYLTTDLLSQEPLHFVVGYGLGATDFEYLRMILDDRLYSEQSKYVRTPTPSVTVFRYGGDLGLLTLALYTFALLWISIVLRRRGREQMAAFLVAGYGCAMTSAVFGLMVYLFLAGAIVADHIAGERNGATAKLRTIGDSR